MKIKLDEIREQQSLSRYKLAKKTLIHQSVINRIANGENKDPRISTLIKIADALDVSLDELVGREFPKK